MKGFITIFILLGINLISQEFIVEKVSGDVKYLRGSKSSWEKVIPGSKLLADDFIETDEKSFIQLNKDGKKFMLSSSSALGLNYIKEISLNDLLLALAMEEIRNVPQKKNETNISNTAVYGSKIKNKEDVYTNDFEHGLKRLNGAKQLNEFGYSKSAVIAAKETYRNYPSTKKLIDERLYFADILIQLKLFEEALTELNNIKENSIDEKDINLVQERINKVKLEML
ncbi:MAG: hypothetical protein K8F60_06450 [Melioribacteraceae bacterium]|jgi:hypothetical protein|nr:hypothetical protein [Ignavibacteriota bacterium]MBZ0182079.1 hypothetical protein [Melioribacteraceae bacterium]